MTESKVFIYDKASDTVNRNGASFTLTSNMRGTWEDKAEVIEDVHFTMAEQYNINGEKEGYCAVPTPQQQLEILKRKYNCDDNTLPQKISKCMEIIGCSYKDAVGFMMATEASQQPQTSIEESRTDEGKKRTAMGMMLQYIQENKGDISGGGCATELQKKASELLEVEKQQIIKAWVSGSYEGRKTKWNYPNSAKQYFTTTYKQVK